MSYTKRQLIVAAFTEIGLGSYDFDLSADQLEAGLQRLDAMVAQWSNKGIRLGYTLTASPEDSNISQDSGVAVSAVDAIITNLAIRLAPSYGKTVPLETRTTAREAYDDLLAQAGFPQERQVVDLPSGAGAKSVDEPFLQAEDNPAVEKPEPSVDFE